MTTTKQDILARLAEAFPQTFVLEKYRPHRPLKVGIAADLVERAPELDRRKLSVALSVYTRRLMYLRGLVAGAARVDLDGKAAGEVTARDAKYAVAKLAGILASREVKRAAAVQANKSVARAPRHTLAGSGLCRHGDCDRMRCLERASAFDPVRQRRGRCDRRLYRRWR